MTYRYSITELNAPTAEPVTVSELKQFLRITHTAEDDILARLITAARVFCENFTGRSFITRLYRVRYTRLLSGVEIKIPHAPLVSVVEVKRIASDETMTMIAADEYTVDTGLSVIHLNGVHHIPNYNFGKAILEIDFEAGYGNATDVPEALKQAIIMKATQLYEDRDGDRSVSLPFDLLSSLLKPYKKVTVV